MLEGVVTNVAAFGAFVDVGVHQDGLVHVSAASAHLRQGPARGGEVRRRGEGEGPRGRCPAPAHRLTLRLDDEPGKPAQGDNRGGGAPRGQGRGQQGGRGPAPARNQGQARQGNGGGNQRKQAAAPTGSMADALRAAGSASAGIADQQRVRASAAQGKVSASVLSEHETDGLDR